MKHFSSNNSCKRYGMLLCKACIDPTNLASKVKSLRVSSKSEAGFALSHPRASGQHSATIWHVLSNDYHQAGERCGPVTTLEAIDRIIAIESSHRATGSRKVFKTDLLETLMSGIAGQTAPGSPQLLKLTNLYAKILPTAQIRRDDDCKRDSKRKANKKLEAATAKRQKYETIMNSIRELLGDAWWKGLATESYLFTRLTAGFESKPSQCTRSRIQAVANTIVANFSLLPKEFLDGSFFRDHDEEYPLDAFESAFRSEYPDESAIRKKLKFFVLRKLGTGKLFTALIENRQLKEAVMCGFMYCDYDYNRPTPDLPQFKIYSMESTRYYASMPSLFETWHFSTAFKPSNSFFTPGDMWNTLSYRPPPDLPQFKTMFDPTVTGRTGTLNITTSDVATAYRAISDLFHCASALHELAASFFDHSFDGDTMFERKFPFFYSTQSYHVPSLTSTMSPSLHTIEPGAILAAAQEGTDEGLHSKKVFLKCMSREIFLKNVHKPMFRAALECGQFKEAFWFGWLMYAQRPGGRDDNPHIKYIFPKVLGSIAITEEVPWKYHDMILYMVVSNDDVFANARAWKKKTYSFAATTLAEAYEAFPAQQRRRILDAYLYFQIWHTDLSRWLESYTLREDELLDWEAGLAAIPRRQRFRGLLHDMVCRPRTNSGVFYTLVMRFACEATLLLDQRCLRETFSTVLKGRARGTAAGDLALDLLWKHLVQNDAKCQGVLQNTWCKMTHSAKGHPDGFLSYASVVNMKVGGAWGNKRSIVVQASPAVAKNDPAIAVGLLMLDKSAHLKVLEYLEPNWV
jgi:hypothetical protein